MDMFHTGNYTKLIELNTNIVQLIITGGKLSHRFLRLPYNRNHPAHVSVRTPNQSEYLLRTITDFGELVPNSGTTMRPSFFENGSYRIVIQLQKDENLTIYLGGQNITTNFHIYGSLYIGDIRFQSDIGYTTMEILQGNNKLLGLTFEVFPTKLDYYKDYKMIINEINEEVAALAFKYLDMNYLRTQLRDTAHQTNTEFISILDVIFADLIRSLQRIEASFKHNVVNTEKLRDFNRAKKISPRTRGYIKSHPEQLFRDDKGFLNIENNHYGVKKVIELHKVTTIDIFENRLLKNMIQRLINRIKIVEKHLRFNDQVNSSYTNILHQKRELLEKNLRQYFSQISDLTGNKSLSLIFQMAPGYKEFYAKYTLLNKGLDLGEDLFRMTPKKLYELYEIWCYLRIHKILGDLGYEVEEYGMLKHKDNGLYLSLSQDSEAKMVYSNSKNRLELWYNKSFSSPTTNQRPDTVLYINKVDNDKSNRVYIFDAKYRLTVDDKGQVGPMEEDINVMHRYRDSIVSRMGDDFKYKYETFGAYVMFPYWDEFAFKSHPFYKSILEVNVGAFPMLPGSTQLMESHLKNIISQSKIEANSERVATDEFDTYAKFKLENVIVVNVKDKAHFNSYIENQFYHIPTERLADVRLGIEYIAFYQPETTFSEEAGIKYYAKIYRSYTYKRKDCHELPIFKGLGEEPYLRIEFDKIKSIGPIMPIQYGPVLMMYTTLYLLLNADNIHELKLSSDLEIALYKRLKAFSEETETKIKKQNNQYKVGNMFFEVENGRVILCNGKIISLKDVENLLQKIS